jgi:hypothetical protein
VRDAEGTENSEPMPWASVRVADAVPIHVRRGEIETARQLFGVARARTDEHNDEIRARVGCVEVELLRAEGRYGEAFTLANQILELIPALGLPELGIKRALAQGVEAAIELGDLAAAESMLGVARNANPGLVTPSLRGAVARLGARASAEGGHQESVEPGFLTAIAVFRDIEMPFELGVALLEFAEWLDGQSRHADAAAGAIEALALFERLGARPWIERARRLLGTASSIPRSEQRGDMADETVSATAHG